MSFQSIEMEINKRENGKFAPLGKQTIFVPLLKDILPFVTADIAKDDKGVDKWEDGLPVYVADEANWVQGAIYAMAKMQARNKIQKDTAILKEGAKIAETWAELCAEGERGNGAALALAREFKTAFADWIAKQGISEGAQNALITLVSNKAALQTQNSGTKEKVSKRLEAFSDSLEVATLEKFQRPIESAMEACKTVDALAELE